MKKKRAMKYYATILVEVPANSDSEGLEMSKSLTEQIKVLAHKEEKYILDKPSLKYVTVQSGFSSKDIFEWEK